MADEDRPRSVTTEMQLRVTCPDQPGRMAAVLDLLRQEGGALRAHLVLHMGTDIQGHFVCERPAEAAAALQAAGIAVETETIVLVRTENRWGAVSHLVRSLEEEGIRIAFTCATAWAPELCVVLRTDDNPKAEDVLRNYLVLPDAGAGETSGT